ncbi:hypothetical protein LDL63_20980 (plasmid) [Ensifer adhaerens]|nr:hypothetical protein [Ensifer adhaerens]UCM23429.1 hypothetical protein LDL63_20980 [Ensifer adhaerens]
MLGSGCALACGAGLRRDQAA